MDLTMTKMNPKERQTLQDRKKKLSDQLVELTRGAGIPSKEHQQRVIEIGRELESINAHLVELIVDGNECTLAEFIQANTTEGNPGVNPITEEEIKQVSALQPGEGCNVGLVHVSRIL